MRDMPDAGLAAALIERYWADYFMLFAYSPLVIHAAESLTHGASLFTYICLYAYALCVRTSSRACRLSLLSFDYDALD